MGTRQNCLVVREVGKRLRQVREARQLTLMDVARDLDYAYQNLSAVELGKINIPLRLLSRLARYYDVPLASLVEGLVCNQARPRRERQGA